MAGEESGAIDDIVDRFNTYEEFLDSQISQKDVYYLEDEELARQLVELGYRGSGDALKREEFEQRKLAAEAARLAKRTTTKPLSSAGKVLEDPLLRALADREESNRTGKSVTIIFLRALNSHHHEISGYIDYAHRLNTEEFVVYFDGKKKLLPKATDLSFYNWKTQLTTSCPTPNYSVIADNGTGLLFKNKRDRKILDVDPRVESPGDNSQRVEIQSPSYIQVVLFDHLLRRKT